MPNGTVDDALARISSGARLYVHGGAATPTPLLEALTHRAHDLRDVETVSLHLEGPAPHVAAEMEGHIRHNALFIGANVRSAVQEGRADFTPAATYDDALDANGLDPVPVVAFDTVDAGGATGSISLADVNGGVLEIGDTLLVTVSDSDLDTTGGVDSAVVIVHSSATDTTGFALILTETGASTGVFTATFKLESATNAGATPPELGASVGELITATYDDAHNAAGGDPAPVSATDTVDPVPPDNQGQEFEDGEGRGREKATVCHVPPGNPSRAKTLTVGAPALGAHLGHGDTEGACS